MKRVFIHSSIIALLALAACNAQKSVEPGERNTLPIGIERTPDTTKTSVTEKTDTVNRLPDTLLKNKP